MSDLEKIGSVLPAKAKPFLDNMTDSTKLDFLDFIYQAAREEKIINESTPADFIKEREGAQGRMLEYHTEEYVIRKLNEHYPGWWCEDMSDNYEPSLRTTSVMGYLCVNYPSISGVKVRKVWAKGSERIELVKGSTTEPSQPEDRDAAARTRWLKLCAKWYGIGLDIYSQRITGELREQFEDRIMHWNEYAQSLVERASAVETGAGMRRLIREIHPVEQTKRLMDALVYIPKDFKTEDETLLHHKIWTNFAKLKSNSDENRKALDDFLLQVEAVSNKMKEKQNE